jgi:hypothetical protein
VFDSKSALKNAGVLKIMIESFGCPLWFYTKPLIRKIKKKLVSLLKYVFKNIF